MPSTIGIGNDKAPVGVVCAYRSDGDTIPVIAAGTEVVGDVLDRDAAVQAIGVVQSLDATDMTGGSGSPTADAVATAGSVLQVRLRGMFYFPKAVGALADAARVTWSGTDMVANATGAHEVVGGYESADAYALVRINIAHGAVT